MSVRLTQFEELISSIKKYGVSDFSKTDIQKEIEQFKEGKGLDSDLSDVFHTNKEELFTVLKDGSIRKTVIHIVDISNWKEDYRGKHPKFHIYNCRTIKEMKQNKRGHRYKVSGRKDGKFFLIKDDKKWYESLEICGNCLTTFNLNFKTNKTKQSFKIKTYIEKSFQDDAPKINAELDICSFPNRYSENWSEISKKRKEQENYKCEKCRIDLSKHKKFLHTHHVDGNKTNNTKENLKVLCIECHAKEFNHSHIKETSEYKEFIKKKKEDDL